MKLSVGILAGGRSSRMGCNKALLTIEHRRFLDKIAEEMSAFDQVLVSAAHKEDYPECGFPVVEDVHRDIGPIEGIYQVIKHASNDYVFVCAVDMPNISRALVSYLAEFICSDYDCYVLTDEDRIHPLCAIYSKKALPALEKLIQEKNYRLRDIFRLVPTKYIRLESSCFSKKTIKNVNTRIEYQKIVLPATFCVSGWKDSGKTGLIIKLINEFIKAGYTVAVIKHDGHAYSMDHKGTDTYRYAEAGARMSAIFSDEGYAVNYAGAKTLVDMLALAQGEGDIIIVEGEKSCSLPKVEVRRREASLEPACSVDTLICIATDAWEDTRAECPVHDLNDIRSIFKSICDYFGLERM